MSSNLRVNSIVPASGTNVAIGTAGGTISYNANVSGVSTFTSVSATTVNATRIVGVNTIGVTTAYVTSINDGPLSGARNRIINGDMRIDQRNNGASVTPGSNTYTLDRWGAQEITSGASTVIRSGVVPVGFTSSLLWTTTTANSSPSSSDAAAIYQQIEGYNVSDLNWGSSNAKPITLSFYVRSSLSGTFGGSVKNSIANRSYPYTYSIAAGEVNTWVYRTITIPGDTTGTWYIDNNSGMIVAFDLGSGSTYQGTANAWGSTNYYTAPGTVSVIGTLNATFYITGVQLEAGTVATPFERRSYGQELALCQRYYYDSDPFSGTSFGYNGNPIATATTICVGSGIFPVPMRAVPTVSLSQADQSGVGGFTVTASQISVNGFVRITSSSGAFSTNGTPVSCKFIASIEL